jgi:hemerythrin superfamily protein
MDTAAWNTTPQCEIARRLERDHRELRALMADLIETAGNDSTLLPQSFSELERVIDRHIGFEQQVLMPTLRRDGREWSELRRSHRRLWRKITDLRVAVDLHQITKDQLRELNQELANHELLEQEQVFPALANLPSSLRGRVLECMRTGLSRAYFSFASNSVV